MGKLYLVATPIGNLDDITLRALHVLETVDLVAAEDTRHTLKLLTRCGLERLQRQDVALVSDAGTPALSDPGVRLVSAALAAGQEIVPVPGPSAVLAALVASGLPTNQFTFLGFLPRKRGELERLLREAAEARRTFVFFESPHRSGCFRESSHSAALWSFLLALRTALTSSVSSGVSALKAE